MKTTVQAITSSISVASAAVTKLTNLKQAKNQTAALATSNLTSMKDGVSACNHIHNNVNKLCLSVHNAAKGFKALAAVIEIRDNKSACVAPSKP